MRVTFGSSRLTPFSYFATLSLPLLLNVVRGEMELVGPRPIAPGLNRMLCEAIPGFNHRYLVKPGLTNVSQVSVLENALGDKAIDDWKLRFEGEEHYIRNKSVSYDLILIALTTVFVLRKAVRRIAGPRRRRGELVRMPRTRSSRAGRARCGSAWLRSGRAG